MGKEYDVREAVKALFTEKRYYSATAGEIAKRAKVSTNTAKKYLRKIVSENVGVYDYAVQLNNGLVATYFAFDNKPFED